MLSCRMSSLTCYGICALGRKIAPTLKERISLTRDEAFSALAFASMRRGHDLSFTLGSPVLRLPNAQGLTFNFHFGETHRDSTEAVLVSPDVACPSICAVTYVLAYIGGAEQVGWDPSEGYLLPVVEPNGPGLRSDDGDSNDRCSTGPSASGGPATPLQHALSSGWRFSCAVAGGHGR